MSIDWNQYNQKIIAEFRENAGKVGGDFAGAPVLILTTRGAKSGRAHVTPLVYTLDGDDFVIIASKAGLPTHPDWYHNLVANEEATLEVGRERFPVRARVAEGEERQRLFDRQADLMPVFHDYARKAPRQIPVIVLKRILS